MLIKLFPTFYSKSFTTYCLCNVFFFFFQKESKEDKFHKYIQHVMKGNNITRLKYFSLAPIAAKLLSIQYATILLAGNWQY